MAEIATIAARDLTLSQLAAVWRDAYAGYYVPLAFDQAQLDRHIRWSQVELDQSVVGMVGGEPVGLSLAGREGDRAWIGGFGIGPRFRLLGLATALMGEHMAQLDAAGVKRTTLEVIDINPAREVYRRAGFTETRDLEVWDGALGVDGVAGEELDLETFSEANPRLHGAPPVWRRGLTRLQGLLAAEPDAYPVGVRRDGQVVGAAVLLNQPQRFGIFDAVAQDAAAATALVSAIAAVRPEAQARLVDEPVGSVVGQALREAGFTVGLRQVEMAR
jgi:ribosomal protein S18 acetylase RimI-like enzyme